MLSPWTKSTTSIVSPFHNRRRGVVGFNPSALFALAEPGVWYDPSDVANLAWRRNLLTWTEQFDNAAWVKTGSTVSANTSASPIGGLTADTLVESAAGGEHFTFQQLSKAAASLTYTYTAYFKAGSGSRNFGLGITDGTTGGYAAIFSTSGSVVASSQAVGSVTGWTFISSSVSADLGGGWYRASLIVSTNTAARVDAVCYLVDGTNRIYAGNGTSSVLIWGAQLELGSVATDYQKITDVNTEVIERFPTATLYQDTAGTTPVTTPGQTVALALDKSKGLVLGSEQSPVLSAYDTVLTGTWAASGANYIFTDTAGGQSRPGVQWPSISLVSGWYQLVVVVAAITGATQIRADGLGAADQLLNVGTNYRIVNVTSTSRPRFRLEDLSTTIGDGFTITSISVKELPGFHATQATTASRPTYGIVPLGGRRNLLTRTEEFGTSPWIKVGAQSVTSDAAVAPNGTTTAEKLIPSSASDLQAIYQGQTFSAVTYTASVYAKAAEYSWLFVRVDGVSNGYVFFNLSSGTIGTQETGRTGSISSQGNGWYRCTVTWTSTGGTGNVLIGASNANATPVFAGNGTSGILVWGAQLETGSTATAYQRVGSAFDVTEAGVASLSYLFFGGEGPPNDARWLVTPTITPGTDKVQVFAGVRKLSDAAQAFLVEHSASVAANNGTFGLQAPSGPAVPSYLWTSKGTLRADPVTNNFAAPVTNVITALGDISGDLATLRVNGTQEAQSTADQGTGNFLAYPLYIGRRGGTTLGFNGQIFSLIVRFGTNLDAGTITSTETWVAGKTGVTL